jgi:hypothetical protein
VRYLLLIALIACGPKQLIVAWVSASPSAVERIEISSSGNGNYTRSTDGVQDKDERLEFTSDQVAELAELFRSHHVCEIVEDPAYTPVAGEGKTTLELMYPDMRCKVTLWDLEWQRREKDITETMRSMRPLKVPRSQRR